MIASPILVTDKTKKQGKDICNHINSLNNYCNEICIIFYNAVYMDDVMQFG
jgi:hypothetical protein